MNSSIEVRGLDENPPSRELAQILEYGIDSGVLNLLIKVAAYGLPWAPPGENAMGRDFKRLVQWLLPTTCQLSLVNLADLCNVVMEEDKCTSYADTLETLTLMDVEGLDSIHDLQMPERPY